MQCFQDCVCIGGVPYFEGEIRGARYYSMSGLKLFGCVLNSFPSKLKSTSCTDFVWPLIVCSNSPVSQSQTFIVESSEQLATTVNVGWNAKPVTGIRWPDKLCRAGFLGIQLEGSRFFCLIEAGAESNSVCNACKRASRSIICLRNKTLTKTKDMTDKVYLFLQADDTCPFLL